jgi:hypothetical protein
VSTSSLAPGSPAPARLVDGEAVGAYGVRTESEPSAWIMIDLQGSYALERVVVHDRADGSVDETVPLVAELSIDAQTFDVIGRREAPFSQDEPWVLAVRGLRGRYVRVRRERPGALVLTEVAVFGRK